MVYVPKAMSTRAGNPNADAIALCTDCHFTHHVLNLCSAHANMLSSKCLKNLISQVDFFS